MTIYVERYNAKIPDNAICVNTTSRSNNWSRDLSPFVLGPVDLYNGYIAENVENAWQYSKVYYDYLDDNGDPSEEYWKWAKKGWSNNYANRYPMGKGMVPEYSYWNGEKLSYIEARKKIYIPIYGNAVKDIYAFRKLKKLASEDKDMYLIDFDGYNHKRIGMSYHEVINSKTKKMGHAFVLAMMLDGFFNK